MSTEENRQVLVHVTREVPLAGAEEIIASAIHRIREDVTRLVAVNIMFGVRHARVIVMAEGPSQQVVEKAVAKHFPATGEDLRQKREQEGAKPPYSAKPPGLWAAD